ncbi:MAG: isoleucine--tRNA ligase [Methanotrichaceae archaeon]|nr:isoleucine--tRNA ligase [Methanotrichaceae archaeon]
MITEVAGQYDAGAVEERVRRFWEESEIYSKVRRIRQVGRRFFFVDGPPYTTGKIHLGTAWNKVIKDCVLRYRSMSGYHVRDRPGWDMHGLPIEVKVEEFLGFTNKRQIEEYGVGEFIERCKEFALRQKDEMTGQFKSLGAWMDWDDPYMTLKSEYIEAAWWALKRANERALLERGMRVVNWCPRCQTAIADSEVEYWDETDPSIYVKFPLVEEDANFVIWTTTPWTIPANIGVAVHPDFQYSRVRAWRGGKTDELIMASDLVDAVLKAGRYKDFDLLSTCKGEELLDMAYKHPLDDIVPAQRGIEHKVHLADFVTAENTGLVHIAPGHGIEDFELGQARGMPTFCPVGEDGRYTEEAGEKYAGKYVKEANGEVMDDLEERGHLLAKGNIVHRYGHCWRCKTPIIFIATSQWFLKIGDLRSDMLEEIAKIKWYPDWAGSSRFRDWVSGARDWCISRQRYWGIPLPIWICHKCGSLEVIGTQEELEKRSGSAISDLHRPAVDDVTITCPCGGQMLRVPDVFDVWFDSAVASWATLNFPRDKSAFDEWWPADFITEGHDQTRGWFYSQLGASMVSFGKAPYRSVLMHGFTLDEQGKKMSKSIGNVVGPEEVVGKHGADTLRFYVLSSNSPWEDLHFSWDAAANTNRMLNILWNAYRFPLPYMILDGFTAEKADLSQYRDHLRPEDRWILSRVNTLAGEVKSGLDGYLLHRVARAISEFVLEDLSRWYIQLVRPRTWIETDDPDKLAAYATLYQVISKLCRLMAPLTPFLAESIYQNLVRGLDPAAAESVHMCDWPLPEEEWIDHDLEERMKFVREISEAVSNARQKAGRKLRWPVAEIIATSSEPLEINDLEGVLKGQTNARKVTIGERPRMDLELEPLHRKIGPVFKGDAGRVIAELKSADPNRVRAALQDGIFEVSLEGRTFPITAEMVEFKEKLPENFYGADFSKGTAYVDVSMTPDLMAEGYSREVIRRIQDMRKEMDLRVEDTIAVSVSVDRADVLDLIQGQREFIAGEVRATELQLGLEMEVKGHMVKEWQIEDLVLHVGIGRS